MYLITSKQHQKPQKPQQMKISVLDMRISNLWQRKSPFEGLPGGLWEIRTLDLFRVKEAL